MVVMLKKMAAKGYIISERDSVDKRKYNIKLTRKSYDLLPELEQIWTSCENAIFKLLKEDLSILHYLDQIEESLKTVSFNERFCNEYYDKIENTKHKVVKLK